MSTFLRFFLPATYCLATRINSWPLRGYNGLVEWLPAIFLSVYFNPRGLGIIPTVLISYGAFICIYEIGYITNDFYSERYETDPRGRKSLFSDDVKPVVGLVISRIIFFLLFTYAAGSLRDSFWWVFHASLMTTFILHNSLPSNQRIPTFFALSTYRFFGPVILSLSGTTIALLLPTILLNNSLYRTSVYIRNKAEKETASPLVRFKFTFYAGCLPLSIMLSVLQDSAIPAMVCLYFMFVWTVYWLGSIIIRSTTKS